jgi:hypothetical protein
METFINTEEFVKSKGIYPADTISYSTYSAIVNMADDLLKNNTELLDALREYYNIDAGNLSLVKTTPYERKEKAKAAIQKAITPKE